MWLQFRKDLHFFVAPDDKFTKYETIEFTLSLAWKMSYWAKFVTCLLPSGEHLNCFTT